MEPRELKTLKQLEATIASLEASLPYADGQAYYQDLSKLRYLEQERASIRGSSNAS